MKKNLVIVESPAKAKTIQKYLGDDFDVLASYGHVRDLPSKTGSVDTEHDFDMHYAIIEKNAKHLDKIRQELKKHQALYLATDPDREGEAIAWHIYQLMLEQGALKNRPIYRIVFHEITPSAIQEALAHPKEINMNLVNAQQARRALDYLVGFELSPLLWRKIQKGLSAGRVQSPALRLIAERETEIENFKSQEYWTLLAECVHNDLVFQAKLIEHHGKKLEQFSITEQNTALSITQELKTLANGWLVVSHVEKKIKKRNPPPPFITSTLQQEASRKLGFSTKKTMMLAQQLYEGIDIGSGAAGLITYMRTDSTQMAAEAVAEIRAYIESRYGSSELPEAPRLFQSKVKNAQEAHEAIRPTSVTRHPDDIHSFLSEDQYKLYSLIWKRAVASQMIHATINTLSIDLDVDDQNRFRATGSSIAHAGYLALYEEGKDDSPSDDQEGAMKLPLVKEGEKIELRNIIPSQHFTEPPPRYTEASLVKTLEEYGIGRPSTYSAIISTLLQREYVTLVNKRFHPSDLGRIVNRFLTQYFTQYLDYHFTAHMEDKLDEISRGEKVWVPVLQEFWQQFKPLVDEIASTVKRKDVASEALEEACPQCGKPLSIRLGKNGRFIGCSGYPDCRYTRNLDGETNQPEIVEGRVCPLCQSPLQIRAGRYGKFIGCTGYPNCKFIESLVKPTDTGVECPECHKGTLLKRKSRRGKIFFSCSTYPTCQYSVWNPPIAEACPKCAWPILTTKTTKRYGTQKVCPRKECGYQA